MATSTLRTESSADDIGHSAIGDASRPERRPGWRGGWTALAVSAVCRGVLAMLGCLLLWAVLPAAFGWPVTVVMSGSMEPLLHPGDVVASRPIAGDAVRPGQVLLVNDPDHAGRLRLHRLAVLRPDGTLTLRGDANPADDSTPVRRSAVHGVGSLMVPKIGLPAYWARTHQIGPLAASAAALGLLIGGAWLRRDEDDAPDDAPDDDADGDAGSGDNRSKHNATFSPLPSTGESDIRRAAFVGRGARRAGISVIAVGLVSAGLMNGPAALAAPFRTSTSTASTWTAASTFAGCGSVALADKPDAYYPLTETSGATASDTSGNGRNGTYRGGVTHTSGGGPCSDTPAVATFDGSGMISTAQQIAAPGPNIFTEEIWFRTTDYRGGSLMAYTNSQTGTPSQYDRQLYLDNGGHVLFGVYTGSVQTIASTRQYNDGAWHLATATLSRSGMKLYVDGARVASNTSVTTAENAAGYWRIGKSNFSGWTSPPDSQGLIGDVSGAAIYSTALSASRITAHFNAR